MAITKLGSIHTTLNLAIDYILNPIKTDNGRLVETYGCSKSNGTQIANEFMQVRACGTGLGTTLAQHIKQSFKANEITPEEALQIAKETADRLLKGKYQYVVSAHINTENVHAHIIFNNIDMVDYRSFEYLENRDKVSWKNLRRISDEIYKEHNISVIENPKSRGKCYYEWQQDYLGKSWKSQLRHLIDEAIMQSANFEEFLDCRLSLKMNDK